MLSALGIRTKIALAAAIATTCLLSVVGAVGYLAMVNATQASQVELLDQRLDEIEKQLENDDGLTVGRSQIDSSIRIVRTGTAIPPEGPNTLRVIRPHESEEIEAIVGLVDTQRIDATLATIRVSLWISVMVIGLLVGLSAWIIVGRALAPVRRLTMQAETNMMSRSMEPLEDDAGHGEISQLAATFNAMLGRLRNADDERRRFVSDASHELRTPLMVLGADAEYALSHNTDSGELASSVLAQTDRLTSLVDDLLTLATLDETETAPLETTTVDAVLSDAEASPLIDADLGEVGELRIPDVAKALGNIVVNARRYSAGEVAVAVERRAGFVRFVIDDDGPGIPLAERDEIFKRFYRPDSNRTRKGGGAGLGLAIARSEVVEIGGSIRVGQSPLGGARFVLDIPTRGA